MPDDRNLRARLAAAEAECNRLSAALELRNAALDAATTHVMIVDATCCEQPIVYVNRQLALHLGYSAPDELIGRNAVAVFDRIADRDAYAAMQRTLALGQPASAESEIVRQDGTKFWAGFTTVPVRNPRGEVTHYLTLGADITARRESARVERELQQQLRTEMQERERVELELRLAQKLESIGRFAAGLAHEINTPIQYVGDSVHFLQAAFADLAQLFQAYRAAAAGVDLRELEASADFAFLSQEVPRAFARSLEGVERVAAIVRAMKEFAYPHDTGHAAADLNHALATTLTVTRSEYKLVAQIDTQFGELEPTVCNVGELNQVFLNLIMNAAHAIQDSGQDAGTGRITIATRQSGDSTEITIADNGCGIAPDDLHKIFDPFFTTKEVGRGTGQGLAIARSIVVDRHGGRIAVSSVAGGGTRFVVQLPTQGRAAKAA